MRSPYAIGSLADRLAPGDRFAGVIRPKSFGNRRLEA